MTPSQLSSNIFRHCTKQHGKELLKRHLPSSSDAGKELLKRHLPSSSSSSLSSPPPPSSLPSTSSFLKTISKRSFSTSTSIYEDDNDDDNNDDSRSGYLFRHFNPTNEHSQLRDMVKTFVEREVEPQANEYNKHEKLNLPLLKSLGKDLGLLGLTIPTKYNGSSMDATASVIVHEELSYSDPSFCLSYLAHSVLFCNNLNVNGTSEQKEKWLPNVCDGVSIGGMCMSEPNAGTDVLGMKSNAVFDQDLNGYVLNGTKVWITNGTLDKAGETGDIYLVYARTGTESKLDITSFVVEKGMEGFTLGQKIEDKLGMRASPTAELVFDNVFIPQENVIGGQDYVNNATLCMMRNLEIERVVLAAMALGIARRCIDEMVFYSKERTAFGKSTIEFGQIQKAISESYAEYMAGRSYVYAVANGLDLDSYGNGLDADGVKLYAAQMAKNVADRAIQVMGGYGYVGEYKVERLWRDAKLLEIGGGTNESHHKNMIRDLKKMGNKLL
jgi:isovaleryl-CoA dehydrogenase